MATAGGDWETPVHLQGKITEAWKLLNEIWAKFGYDEDNLKRRQKAVVKHVSELLDEMVQEADERLNEQQQKLDNLMKEIIQLTKDLSIDRVPELDAASGKTLLEMEKVFLDVANVLRKRKAVRMEKYNTVNDNLLEICEELEEVPMKIEFDGIPADSQVAKLEQHLVYMHQEKSHRIDKFNKLRQLIADLFELLERSPKNELEYLVTNFDDKINSSHPISAGGIKALSTAVLDKLEEMYRTLREQLESNTQKGEELWQKIRDLWSRLNVDEELINAFTHVNRPISKGGYETVFKPSVLKGLHVELERLEEEKRRNMSLFVKQVREELSELWMSRCFMTSVEDRFTEQNYWGITSFTISDFTSDLYTEELLEKHEREVEFWRGFVDRNKAIIEGVTKRGHMFAQYKTLDQKSDDPSRLANRGGALLKEEKERKKLEKTIPKVEAELKQLCQAFEEGADDGHGMRKFLVYGRTIEEMIEQDWEQFHEEKRLRKEAKKKPDAADAKNKTMMTTQMGAPGSSRKRPAPGTPSSTLKSGIVTPKRNRTQAMTPGKTIQSPFLHPASATKRPLTKSSRPPKGLDRTNDNASSTMNQYFRPNTSRTQAASRKVLRKSIGKVRNNSSVKSWSDSAISNASSLAHQKSSISQPNMQVSSLEQLNFSEVIRGHGPVVDALKVTKLQTPPKPKRVNSKDNFAMPTGSGVRSTKKTPTKPVLSRQASSGRIPMPSKVTGKEQVPPQKPVKDTVVSPDCSYSEFTDHLLCQSTLNSSVVPIKKSTVAGAAPTTPTKSGMSFAPAKLPLSDNCF